MQLMIALISGLLFGAGLTISQMVDPAKVLNFLDIFGYWDPSLAFVMGGAISVFSLGYFFLVKPRKKPTLAVKFLVPTETMLTKRLIIGAIIFGVGWALAGICPGPALSNLSGGNIKILAFIIAMLVGMQLSGLFSRLSKTE